MSKEKEELKDSAGEVYLVRERSGAMDLDKLMCQFRIHASAPGRRMGCPPVLTQSSHQQDGQNAYYISVRIVEYCLWTFPLLTVLQHFMNSSEKLDESERDDTVHRRASS